MPTTRPATTVLAGGTLVPIHIVTMAQAIEEIMDASTEDRSYVVTPNLYHMRLIDEGQVSPSVYQGARLSLADGWPVAKIASRRSRQLVSRVAGSDLLEQLLKTPGQGRPLAFVGGTSPESVRPLLERSMLSGWRPFHDPAPVEVMADPSSRRDSLRAVSHLADGGVIVLGLGAPKQENFAREMLEFGGTGVILCLGMSINFSSGEVKRAGKFSQVLRAEWLHRMLREPKRLGPRYLADGRFYLRFLRNNKRARQ